MGQGAAMRARKHFQKLGVLGLIAATLLVVGIGQRASADDRPVQASKYRLSGPYTHANLAIFLIHGDDELKDKTFLTLQEALQQKKVVVHETKQVNELAIENLSPNEEVFVQAGDIVKGGQQDRVIAYDLIVAAKSGRIPIASFCVEAGRWQGRGRESGAKFDESNAQAPTKGLKLAVRKSMGQGEVWGAVAGTQLNLLSNGGVSARSELSPSSLQLTLEHGELQKAVEPFLKALEPILVGKKDVIGVAFAVNGQASSADVYVSHILFAKLWPALLRGSAVEALAELKKDQKFAPATTTAVAAFLADMEKGKVSEKEVTKRVRLIQRETPKGILFESRDVNEKNAPARRSYLAK
jgi:hypothetical protein